MVTSALRAISMIMTFAYTIFALTTCSNTTVDQVPVIVPQKNIPIGASGQAAVVNIMLPYENISLDLQEAVDLYLSETKENVRINIQTIQGKSAYKAALRGRLLSGEQVDVFHVFGQRDILELEEFALDISSMSWVLNAHEYILEPVSIEDKNFGIPYSLEGVGLIANKRIFSQAEISLNDIVTAEDLLDAFASLRRQILAGELSESFPKLEVVTEFPANDKKFLWEQIADIAFTDVFKSHNKIAESRLIEIAYPDAVEQYIRLLARYTTNRSDLSKLNYVAQNSQIEYGISIERIAVIHQNINKYNKVKSWSEEVANQLTLLPIPLDSVENSFVYVGAPSYWAFNIKSSTESTLHAQKFITWLYNSKSGKKILAEKLEIVSPYLKSGESANPLGNQLISYMNRGRAKPLIYNEFPEYFGEQVFAENLQKYLADEKTWKEFLLSLQEGWN